MNPVVLELFVLFFFICKKIGLISSAQYLDAHKTLRDLFIGEKNTLVEANTLLDEIAKELPERAEESKLYKVLFKEKSKVVRPH